MRMRPLARCLEAPTMNGCARAPRAADARSCEEDMRTLILETRRTVVVSTVLLALIASPTALAKNVVVQLNGKSEVPAVTTTATGQGTLTVNDDKTVSGS